VVTRVPIDGDMAAWARKRCHLEIDDAANLLKCDAALLQQIETGAQQPTAGLFRAMAEKYMLPEATLLGLAPAEDRPLPKDFRSFEGAPVRLSYQTIKAVRVVQARQEALARLAEIDESIEPPTLPSISLSSDPEVEGAKYRRAFGFDVPTQIATTAQKAFVRWRTMVEQLGVSVYVEPLGDDTSRGVSDNFNGFPAIIIDQREKFHGARLFTLFHELAHHFVGQVGISNLKNANGVERFCNRFAAAFLMPRDAVALVLPNAGPGKPAPTIEDLDRAARGLSVTISQMALRMEDLGYAGAGYYKNVKAALSVSKKSGGPEYRYTYLSQYGDHLPRRVLGALDAGLISTVEAARAMNTSPAHFDDIRRTLMERQPEPVDGRGR
jgi:Zn-dependent peptidase ImmA (M78 family)/transcriptional regulator with XRE-family HTH domain